MASIPTPYLPKEDKVDFSEYIQDKSKNFVGRESVFEELKSIIPKQEISYIILRACVGMGKSAIMAQLALNTKSPKKNNKRMRYGLFTFVCTHKVAIPQLLPIVH